MERAVVAGVEHHEVRLRVEALEVLQVDDDEPSVFLGLLGGGLSLFRSKVPDSPPLVEELRSYVEVFAESVLKSLGVLGNLLVAHSGFLPLGGFLAHNVVWARIPAPAVAVLLRIVCRGFLVRNLGDVLLVDASVLVEEDCVNFRPLELVEQAVLHIVLVTEIQLLEVAGRVLDKLEVFLQGDTLVHPGDQTVAVVAVAGEGHDVVQCVLHLVGLHAFLEEGRDCLILVPAQFCRILDPGGIVGRIQMLGAVGLQVVVEEVCVHAVSSDIFEVEVEVIVEAVASHAGLVAVELVLVHLEGGGHVLGVAHHCDRNVADEHDTLHVLCLLVEFLELVSQLHRVLPVASENVSGKAVCLSSIAIVIHLFLAGVEGGVVDNDHEGVALLYRRLLDLDVLPHQGNGEAN